MPSTPADGSVRSVAVVNEAIRALWQQAGGRLTGGQRREYEQLLVEYADAVRRDVTEAA
jgi:hypothetical protein